MYNQIDTRSKKHMNLRGLDEDRASNATSTCYYNTSLKSNIYNIYIMNVLYCKIIIV